MIMEATGCSEEVAVDTWNTYKDVVLAIDSLFMKPVVAGDKYMPMKPVINTGLTEEQQERCAKGRDLQDKINSIFSVAQSKLKSQQDPLVLANEEVEKVQ